MAEDNVTRLNVVTTLPLDPDHILDAAKGKLEHVVIVGRTKDGGEYLAFSDPDMGHAVFDMERAKLKLLREFDDE
jgi:hypothetical protein